MCDLRGQNSQQQQQEIGSHNHHHKIEITNFFQFKIGYWSVGRSVVVYEFDLIYIFQPPEFIYFFVVVFCLLQILWKFRFKNEWWLSITHRDKHVVESRVISDLVFFHYFILKIIIHSTTRAISSARIQNKNQILDQWLAIAESNTSFVWLTKKNNMQMHANQPENCYCKLTEKNKNPPTLTIKSK